MDPATLSNFPNPYEEVLEHIADLKMRIEDINEREYGLLAVQEEDVAEYAGYWNQEYHIIRQFRELREEASNISAKLDAVWVDILRLPEAEAGAAGADQEKGKTRKQVMKEEHEELNKEFRDTVLKAIEELEATWKRRKERYA